MNGYHIRYLFDVSSRALFVMRSSVVECEVVMREV